MSLCLALAFVFSVFDHGRRINTYIISISPRRSIRINQKVINIKSFQLGVKGHLVLLINCIYIPFNGNASCLALRGGGRAAGMTFRFSQASREKVLDIKSHPEVGRLARGLAHKPLRTKQMDKIEV